MESLQRDGDSPASSETLTADLRDGQLQIVEVDASFDKDDDDEVTESLQIGRDDGSKYVHEVSAAGKGLMQLDLLNLTFVRCEDGDGDESYRLVTNTEPMDSEAEYVTPDSVQVMLQSSEEDNDEPVAGESYVMVEGHEEPTAGDSYVMIEGEDGPVFYLQSDLKPTNALVNQAKKSQNKTEAPETTIEMLQKAKALAKAKHLLRKSMAPAVGRGRRRRLDLPTPDEILSSPNFRLFLYSCKMCPFRCNAVRELTEHRIQCHGTLPGKGKQRPGTTLQCARCPYRGITHFQLMRHAQDNHLNSETGSQLSATLAATTAEILVCGACGLESADRDQFREHLRQAHGAVH